MGYMVTGYGDARLKAGVDTKKLGDVLNKIAPYIEIDFYDDHGISTMGFSEYDSHWHEEDTEKFLEAIVPYIESGSAEYHGEDANYWKYVLEESGWNEYDGTIYYTQEEMIEELEKHGYVVSKIRETNS